MKTVHQIFDPDLGCPECPRVYKTCTSLKAHRYKKHNQENERFVYKILIKVSNN